MFKIMSDSGENDFVVKRPPDGLLERRFNRWPQGDFTKPTPLTLTPPTGSFDSPKRALPAPPTEPSQMSGAKRRRSSYTSDEHYPYLVAPNIFVGCMGSSKNSDAITRLQISHVIRISDSPTYYLELPIFDGIHYYCVPFKDTADTYILGHISTIYSQVLPALLTGEGFLSHCQMGQSRSVAMVMGIMLHLFYSGQMEKLPPFLELFKNLSVSQSPVLDLFVYMSTKRTEQIPGSPPLFPEIMAPNVSFMAQLELIRLMYVQDRDTDFDTRTFFTQHLAYWSNFYRSPQSGFSPDQLGNLDIDLAGYQLGLFPEVTPNPDSSEKESVDSHFPEELARQLSDFLKDRP